MIERFADAAHPTPHERFVAWCSAHPTGYFLNQRSERSWMLHRPHCSSLAFTIPVSLTASPKLCSLDRAELEEWIRGEQLEMSVCSRCGL